MDFIHDRPRLGLLKPKRSGTGYRLYESSDLARLQQIVALKSVGLPLKDIRTLLDRVPLPLVATFRQQRALVEAETLGDEELKRDALRVTDFIERAATIDVNYAGGSDRPRSLA